MEESNRDTEEEASESIRNINNSNPFSTSAGSPSWNTMANVPIAPNSSTFSSDHNSTFKTTNQQQQQVFSNIQEGYFHSGNQKLDHSSTYSTLSAIDSGKKRNRRNLISEENSLDDILGQITSKLTNLCTVDGKETDASRRQEDSVNAFIEVLKCPYEEASFYLESAAWNIETAVVLWLENNPTAPSGSLLPYSSHVVGGLGSSRVFSLEDYSASNQFDHTDFEFRKAASMVHIDGVNRKHRPPMPPRYRPRDVEVQGLDPLQWRARVCRYRGYIVFVNLLTGQQQYAVPPGFADLDGTGLDQEDADSRPSSMLKPGGPLDSDDTPSIDSGYGVSGDVAEMPPLVHPRGATSSSDALLGDEVMAEESPPPPGDSV